MNIYDRHKIRIEYLDVMSKYKDIHIADAIKYSHEIINGEELSNEIDLSGVISDIKKAAHNDTDDLGELKNVIGNKNLGSILENSYKSTNSYSDVIKIESPSESNTVNVEKNPTVTPVQNIISSFGPMVDPNIKSESKYVDKTAPKVDATVIESRTFGGKLPLRYEDRVKMAENSSDNKISNPKETNMNVKNDTRGFGESGGNIKTQ